MDAEQFVKFRHAAVHELMRRNEVCDRDFRIQSWPRWDYDLDRGTLTFSQDGVAKVIATIQVVGTTSESGGTWLWGWANGSLPTHVTDSLQEVRKFGETEGLAELINPEAPDDEYLGWAMTAIAANILGAKGSYRCPGSNGYIYLIYNSLSYAELSPTEKDRGQMRCTTHESGYETFVCQHLLSDPSQKWFSEEPSEANNWPDAWCSKCDVFFQEHGGLWNEKNEPKLKIKLLCHHCYEDLRSRAKT